MLEKEKFFMFLAINTKNAIPKPNLYMKMIWPKAYSVIS